MAARTLTNPPLSLFPQPLHQSRSHHVRRADGLRGLRLLTLLAGGLHGERQDHDGGGQDGGDPAAAGAVLRDEGHGGECREAGGRVPAQRHGPYTRTLS